LLCPFGINYLKLNQPQNLTKDDVLRKQHGGGPCLIKPFLRTAGIGKQSFKSYSCGYAYVNWFVVFAEGHGMFTTGVVAAGGRMMPLGNPCKIDVRES
jgi:hypothetical protein